VPTPPGADTPPFDVEERVPAALRTGVAADLRAVEELCLNSSATPRQLLHDGWLVRLSPGKARRARSINAFYPGVLPLDDKLARCAALYRAAGLPLIARITPFVYPADLDDALAARGWVAFEETRVMTAAIAPDIAAAPAVSQHDVPAIVAAISGLRRASTIDREAHRQRLESLPLPVMGFAIRHAGEIACTGVAVVEAPWVGLFDVVTHPDHRGQGLASALTAAMLAWARTAGADRAYLQVEARNDPARAVYHKHGFVDRYAYWYRAAP
jgi:GNAT superfamily N-acetyltransferase